MAVIQSGASATQWTIDTTSLAGRMTLYDNSGNPMCDIVSLNNVLNALNSATTFTLGGQSTVGFNVAATSGTLTLSFEATIDNANWFSINAAPIAGGSTVTSVTGNGQWVADLSGFYAVRARISAFTSGSMTVSLVVTPGSSKNIAQAISGSITANIGTSGSLALDATLTGGTQRVRITDGTNNVALSNSAPAGTEQALIVRNIPSGTQVVSGTVTSNIGTTNGLALDATLSKLTVSQSTSLGANTQVLIGGSVTTAAPSYSTGNINPFSLTTSGALRVDASATTQPVSGTVAATQSGTWTVQPGNTANTTPWLSTINQGGNSATVSAGGALKVDASATTQPVSGTVTANAGTGTFTVSGTVTSNIGTTNGLALDTTVSGLQVSQASTTSGQKGDLILGAVTTAAPTYTTAQSNPISLTTAGAIRIDGSGSTQPVSGTVAATQSGIWTVQPGNTANTTPWLATINQGGNSATVTASNALKVDGSAVTQPVSGTVTANAGTGNFTVVQATAANLNATVSGTVTSNQGTANTVGNAWPTKVTDGTNTAAVKAASTAAVAADPSIVVALSPNSPLPNLATVDAANSSTATLTAAAVFTGTGTSGLGYATVTVSVMAIGASAPPGTLSIQQSSDNSNWDVQDNYTVTGGTASPTGEFDISVHLKAKFYRVVYTNGATAQTAFRLQTLVYPIYTPVGNAATQKGIQAQSFVPVQQPKDTGRAVKVYEASATTGTTADTMATLTPLSNFTAGSTGTSFSITAGKVFRLQAFNVAIRNTTATAVTSANFRLRISASGAVTTATAVSSTVVLPAAAAAINAGASTTVIFPGGLELSGTMQFGVSMLVSSASSSFDIQLIGYEY